MGTTFDAKATLMGVPLERARRLLLSWNSSATVQRIWLYGNLAKGAAAVNDVDLAVETSLGAQAGRRRAALPASGRRRHPRVRACDLASLVEMGCECRLVFDADAGGRVDGPLMPRHPDRPGRSPDAYPRLVMPVLDGVPAARPIHPCFGDGDALADGSAWSTLAVGPARGHVRVVGTATADGASVAMYEFKDRYGGRSAWAVSRSLAADARSYAYRMDVVAATLGPPARDVDGFVVMASDAAEIAYAHLSTLAWADVEEAAAHALATSGPGLEASFASSADEDVSERFVARLSGEFREGLGPLAKVAFAKDAFALRDGRARDVVVGSSIPDPCPRPVRELWFVAPTRRPAAGHASATRERS